RAQDGLGLFRIGDQPDGTGRHALGADGCGQRHLVAGADGDLYRIVAAGGDIDEVDSRFRQVAADLGRLGDVESPFVPFAGRDPDEDGHLFTDLGAHGRVHLIEQARATGQVPSVVVA